MSLWFCLTIHAIAVEIYLNLSPAESERLRIISYEKQLEAGFTVPEQAQSTTHENRNAMAWKPVSQSES
ncbi:uncharacterized protein A1O9_01518 [Exophiala aquamarina CBS 119918]|uniref:Uncharacterized protein n=1 Tax=Exophiala aquamarina CBS 119918 TaxID=1182545 RepID=A0A072Q6I5_9EURO|nr:uncharacterized protein A1O9_01518 [Exophiala aquamarina CBS 119918]KEF63540.1 hypothetical protein A1O9_01518 [Exophiala aquamarina CBS 119918]